MAEITAVFPKQERRKAMAVNASVLALAQVTGLVLGGLLIGQFGWRSLFLTMLTVSLLGLSLSVLILEPGSRATGRASLDWMGTILAVGAVGAPFLFIEQLSGLALLAGGATVIALFVVVERRAPLPLLDLSLFRSRGFTCGSVAAAFYFVAAVFGLSFLGSRPSYAEIVLPLVVLGLGGGLFHPPNNSATLNNVPSEHLSVANGFLSTARNFGQTIGPRWQQRSSHKDLDRSLGRRWPDLSVRSSVGHT